MIHLRKWMLIAAFALVLVFGITLFAKQERGISASSIDERVSFAKSLGYTVDVSSESAQTVIIPVEFDSVYTTYNKLQLEAGFDLEGYKGKTAVIYTYEITNYGDSSDVVYMHFIVFDGKLIGGDICSARLNGFMHGLTKTSQLE